jgi:hypothetical protein
VDPQKQELERQNEVLRYAEGERKGHRNVEFRQKFLYNVFQTATIVAAAVATILAVDDTLKPEVRAIPAALATLGASVLAAFQFRNTWKRHRTAARLLDYEILKFRQQLREYRPNEPRPQTTGVDVFLDRVESISRAGHEEAASEEKEAPPEAETVPTLRLDKP